MRGSTADLCCNEANCRKRYGGCSGELQRGLVRDLRSPYTKPSVYVMCERARAYHVAHGFTFERVPEGAS